MTNVKMKTNVITLFLTLPLILTACGGSSSGSGGGIADNDDEQNSFSLQLESIEVSRIESGDSIETAGLPVSGAKVTVRD